MQWLMSNTQPGAHAIVPSGNVPIVALAHDWPLTLAPSHCSLASMDPLPHIVLVVGVELTPGGGDVSADEHPKNPIAPPHAATSSSSAMIRTLPCPALPFESILDNPSFWRTPDERPPFNDSS